VGTICVSQPCRFDWASGILRNIDRSVFVPQTSSGDSLVEGIPESKSFKDEVENLVLEWTEIYTHWLSGKSSIVRTESTDGTLFVTEE
jgi:hypothetical protein